MCESVTGAMACGDSVPYILHALVRQSTRVNNSRTQDLHAYSLFECTAACRYLLLLPLPCRLEQRDQLPPSRELLEQVDNKWHVVVLAPDVLRFPATHFLLFEFELLPEVGERWICGRQRRHPLSQIVGTVGYDRHQVEPDLGGRVALDACVDRRLHCL